MRTLVIVLAVVLSSLNQSAQAGAQSGAEDTATLIVVVTGDVTGDPLDGVPVTIANGANVAERSTEAGVLVADGLPPGGYWIAAGSYAFPEVNPYLLEYYQDHDGSAYAERDIVVLGAGETVEIEMRLALGGRVVGTVRDAVSGEPIPSANLVLSGPIVTGYGIGLTGPDGSFTSDDGGGLAGDYVLRLQAEGFREQELTFSIEPRQELTLEIAMVAEGAEAPQLDTTTTTLESTTTSPASTTTTGVAPTRLPFTGPRTFGMLAAAGWLIGLIGVALVARRRT